MATKWFNNIGSLEKSLGTTTVSESAIKQISKIMENTLIRHIEDDIYNGYSPKEGGWVHGETYERRYDLPMSVVVDREGDELVAYTTAVPDGPIVKGIRERSGNGYGKGYSKVFSVTGDNGGFLRLLENTSGGFGIWKRGFPRPAVRNAQDEIDKNRAINDIIAREISL